MRTIDHMRIVWAITRKDITNALRNRVLLSVALGVLVLVGSSQIGVLLQQLTGDDIVYIYDASGRNLAYLPNLDSTLRLIAVSSDEELKQSLINNPGASIGIKIPIVSGQSLIVDAFYAHWTDRNEASSVANATEQFLQSELAENVRVQFSDVPIYPESANNRTVNSLSITFTIALLAFCSSLVPSLFIEEKRRKTLDVLMVSPASIGDITAGKAVAGMFYGILTSCLTFFLFSPYIIHWGIAILVALIGSMLAVAAGILVGVLLNSYQSINIYSAGMLFLLFLPLVPELLALDITNGVAFLLGLFPIPALMTLNRMLYMYPVVTDVLVLNSVILILWVTAIGLTATWLVTHTRN